MAGYPIAAILTGGVAAFALATVTAGLIGRAGFPLPAGRGRIGCIDGLRGYLSVSVLVHHFIVWLQVSRLGEPWWPPTIKLFNQLGAGGVALFFMVSGFVFYPRILMGFRACSWPSIYTTRVFRIVPMIVVSVIAVTTVISMRTGRGLDGDFPMAAAQWITTWAEPPLLGYPDSGRLNAYVLWSLWYEWLFYLVVLPACALATDLIRGRAPSWVVPLVLLAAPLILRALHLRFALSAYLPFFAIGMLAYECHCRERVARGLRTRAATILAVAALALGMVAAATPNSLAMPLFGFFFICVACGNSFGGLFRTRGALVLGECSYGIYLLHGILLSLLFVEGSGWLAPLATQHLPTVLPLAATVVVLVAAATYVLVERPAIAAGARVAGRWTRRRVRADAPELEVAP